MYQHRTDNNNYVVPKLSRQAVPIACVYLSKTKDKNTTVYFGISNFNYLFKISLRVNEFTRSLFYE